MVEIIKHNEIKAFVNTVTTAGTNEGTGKELLPPGGRGCRGWVAGGGPMAVPLGHGEFWAKGGRMSETLFGHGEVELAEATGVAVRHFQKMRAKNLRQGADWDLNGLRVAYAKNAVPRILDLVTGRAVPPGELAELLEKSALNPAQKSAPETVTATVRKFWMNPRLMQVELPGAVLVNVRVRSVANFLIGMQLPVRQVEGGAWVVARKLPRFPGRW